MAVKIEDRPIETVREEVIDQLIMNYSQGEISIEAFERRLDSAMESNDPHALLELVADLELEVDKEYIEKKKEELNNVYDPSDPKDLDHVVNVFSGSSRSGAWRVAKETRIFGLFSGTDIDLSDAQLTHKTVHIKVYSLFSGVDIYVPENVNVMSKAFCVFGGIDNNTQSTVDRNAPTIVIEGFAIFSGIDIKIKRTLKERFVQFADEMKNLFT